jgi:predicted acylesterase/phospholipase RssA
MAYYLHRSFIVILLIHTTFAFDCIRFRGGGIYFWWQAGATRYLMEKGDYDSLPLYGTSAGALSAALLASKASMQDAAKLAIELSTELDVWDRPTGLAGVWGGMIEDWLEVMIPQDISQEALSRVNVVVTPRTVWDGAQLMNGFSSKSDLIGGTMASIHIPLFLDKKPWRTYKEKKYIDGSFWQFVANSKVRLHREQLCRQWYR